jgi:signal recognition particle subunit SRP54
MFDALSEKLESAFKKLKGEDKLTEKNIEETLRLVRRSLLDADVNLQVVKDFIEHIQEKALGSEVLLTLSPGQQFANIVYDELRDLMGQANVPLNRAESGPSIILMAGLQGTGKTTAAAKLALFLRKENRRALLVACDVYRPAAIDQLRTLAKQIQVPIFEKSADTNPVDIAREAIAYGRQEKVDTIIIDTAGRLQIDEDMMQELVNIKELAQPHEVLLVVDAMTGQEAANLTRVFHERVGITGAVLTKMDGDTRGGAALSIRQVSGQPIKFIGVGEKVEALQPFYPERMASRILGGGDLMTLVEKAQEEIDFADASKLEDKILNASFNLEDFVKQMRMIKKMGSFSGILKLLPGVGGKITDAQIEQGELQLKRTEAMIGSMTPKERRNPDLIDLSRKRRIAKGCGHSVQEVGQMINQFQQMRGMMQQMGRGGFGGMPGLGGMPGMGGMGGGMPGMGGMNQGRMGPAAAGGPGWRGQATKAKPPKPPKKKDRKGFS